MKHNIESKLGYQINKTVMHKLKNGTFPEPQTHTKFDTLSIASTQESVNHHRCEIFGNGQFNKMSNEQRQQMKQTSAQYFDENMMKNANQGAMALENQEDK